MAAKKKDPRGMNLIVSELKRNRNVSYGDIKTKADRKGLSIYPIMYGRAKAMLGLLGSGPSRGSAKRGTKTASAKRRPGRPKGTVDGASKSEQIRQLLDSGLGSAAIAKRVGCSVNLVYAVRSQGGSRAKRKPGRPARAKTTTSTASTAKSLQGGFESLAAGLQQLQRERNAMRAALDKIQRVLGELD